MSIAIATAAEVRRWVGGVDDWPEAEVVAEPLPRAKLGETVHTVVRRRIPDLVGPRDQQLFSLPGRPTISLFTGCGGMDIGLEAAGFCTVVQCEMDPTCCETLVVNRPNFFRHAALLQSDLRFTSTAEILEAANLRVGEASMVCGGPPCQGYSLAGHRDPNDPRNNLIMDFARVIQEAQPEFFMMENVPPIQTSKTKQGKPIENFMRKMHDAYYEICYGLIDCCEYGVPQYRCRFIAMGTRRDLFAIDGLLAALPNPTHFSPPEAEAILQLQRMSQGLYAGEAGRELAGMTRCNAVRYFPERPFLVVPAPLGNRQDNGDEDGWKQRSKSYVKFFQDLERKEPDRVVRYANDVLSR